MKHSIAFSLVCMLAAAVASAQTSPPMPTGTQKQNAEVTTKEGKTELEKELQQKSSP